MEIPAVTLFHFLTTFPEYERDTNSSLLSVHPMDNPIYRVRPIPYDVALLLQQEDPEEHYFHIEFFPRLGRAELWIATAWKESISRLMKLKAEQDRPNAIASRINILEYKIARALMHQVHAERLLAERVAQILVRGERTLNDIKPLTLPLDIVDELDALRAAMLEITEHKQEPS